MKNVKMIGTLVAEYNIRIAIHNHGPEDKQFPTPQSVLEAAGLDPRCGLHGQSLPRGPAST